MTMQKWVKLPTTWIVQKHGLRDLRWTVERGANNLAALMTLIVIAHHADGELGLARLTYDEISESAGLSRAKVSGGLKILEEQGIIERRSSGRSSFQLVDYDPKQRWGKLPARDLYTNGRITFFSAMSLRKPAELHALKLYLLFVAMRDNTTNLARISYDRIELHSGVDRHQIKAVLSVLAANAVVHIEYMPASGDYGIANAYRVAFIEDHQYFGTTLRSRDQLTELLGGTSRSV